MAKSTLVTGANSGIGRATAERFAQGGYKVYATMRSPAKGEELASAAGEQGWDLTILPLDVTDQDSVDAAFMQVHAEVSALDVLVNNAGLGMQAAIEEATDEEINRLFDTNIVGMVRVLRKALPPMRERKSGTIVNLSSMGGHVVWPYFGYYHATKWALEAITESLYLELAPFGINVYAVLPGLVATNFGASSIRGERVKDKTSDYRDDSKRWIEGFMALLPNRVGPESAAEKIFEVAEKDGHQLHHTSDEFAEQIVSGRKRMPDDEWFAHFKGMHGLQ
ncbi:MAG: SDR family oxidoreductase [Actinomycetota bacterium]